MNTREKQTIKEVIHYGKWTSDAKKMIKEETKKGDSN
jgi:hypothetical protein